MDGWESRRRRTPGHDWCVVALGIRGVIRGVNVDTAFFTGNFPSHCSIDALDTPKPVTRKMAAATCPWTTILEQSPLTGDSENFLAVDRCAALDARAAQHFSRRRRRAVARSRRCRDRLDSASRVQRRVIDLASIINGGLVLGVSDMHFGATDNMIMPGRAKNMSDGWETRRRRGPGHDWAIVRLGAPGRIDGSRSTRITTRATIPESASIEGTFAPGATLDARSSSTWTELLPRTTLRAHHRHLFSKELASGRPISHVRLNIFPDGGISRLRDPWNRGSGLIRPHPTRRGGCSRVCCGSTRWVSSMMARRPFGSSERLLRAADETWRELSPDDWKEAFSHHPRIGDRHLLQARFASTRHLSVQEQAGVTDAPNDVIDQLADANREYETRFGTCSSSAQPA